MTGFFEDTRRIVASEVMRLRSLGGRRRDAAMKTWLARQPSPLVEQANSPSEKDAGADTPHPASE
jgi:hypothetical protein